MTLLDSSGITDAVEEVAFLVGRQTIMSILQGKRFPRALNLLGLLIGVAGLLTVVPPFFSAAVAIFALSSIIWFIWLGMLMLPGGADATARAHAGPITPRG